MMRSTNSRQPRDILDMSNPDLAPRAIPICDVGPLLGCSRSTVFGLVRSGQLKARKLRGLTVVLPDDLDAYVQALPDAKENRLPRGRTSRVRVTSAAEG